MPLTQEEFIELLTKLHSYISGDRVTEEDDEALDAITTLQIYATDCMVITDFVPESPLWREEA